jgi:hypothetical protein
MNSKEIFDSTVKNSLDFLQHSINEIEAYPKYSLIHFFSAVEIIFKARLMVEHWSLVFENPAEANLTKFLAGDFRSVTILGAMDRLGNIAKIVFSDNESNVFKVIQDHRNKLIHFYHPEIVDGGNPEAIQKAISEECKGWFYLYPLLTRKWKVEFIDYQEQIEALHQQMKHNRQYLAVKYERLKPDIEKGIKRGINFSECYYCGFVAAKEKTLDDILTEAICLVCENEVKFIRLPCPNCGKSIIVFDMGEGECDDCGYIIDIEYLIHKFGTNQDPKDEFYEPTHAYCSNCERVDISTVIPVGDNYLCLNCFAMFDVISDCEWCNERIAGHLEDSYLSGCPLCEGRSGWRDD